MFAGERRLSNALPGPVRRLGNVRERSGVRTLLQRGDARSGQGLAEEQRSSGVLRAGAYTNKTLIVVVQKRFQRHREDIADPRVSMPSQSVMSQ
jgi:hypothetical protein